MRPATGNHNIRTHNYVHHFTKNYILASRQKWTVNIRAGAWRRALQKTPVNKPYYTIRLLVDSERVEDAYRAYAYFRWVDDVIDETACPYEQRRAFTDRQRYLLDSFYQSKISNDLCAEERMLADLDRNDTERNSDLQTYLRNMMDVMVFDLILTENLSVYQSGSDKDFVREIIRGKCISDKTLTN